MLGPNSAVLAACPSTQLVMRCGCVPLAMSRGLANHLALQPGTRSKERPSTADPGVHG
jgi:hypothetical protein